MLRHSLIQLATLINGVQVIRINQRMRMETGQLESHYYFFIVKNFLNCSLNFFICSLSDIWIKSGFFGRNPHVKSIKFVFALYFLQLLFNFRCASENDRRTILYSFVMSSMWNEPWTYQISNWNNEGTFCRLSWIKTSSRDLQCR